MSRKINDYIQFYIGQTVRITVTKERILDMILVGVDLSEETIMVNLKPENGGAMWYRWDKFLTLLLRPINTMTEAEKITWRRFMSEDSIRQEASATKYLLGRGLDLYDLIDAKLATDKTIQI